MSSFLKKVKAKNPQKGRNQRASRERQSRNSGKVSRFPSTQVIGLHAWVWQSGIPVPGNSLGSMLSLAAADEVVKAGLNYAGADGI